MIKFITTILFIIAAFTPYSSIISQWNLSADLNAGYISSIISDGNSLYAGTSTQGVFRSDNNGLNWIQVSAGFGTSLFIQALAAENSYVYAGTSSGGFFYSTNKGTQWIQSNQGISQQNIKALIADGNTVYAGCIFAGVFRSLNNGGNWSRFALGEGDLMNALYRYDNHFFIGLLGGMYRSTNNGVNWMISDSGITNNDIKCFVRSGNKTYCGTNGGGVFVTTDNGESWSALSTGLADQKINVLFAEGPDVFTGTYRRGIHYLDNSSQNWIQANQGLTDTNITSIAVKDKYIYAASSSGKIWKRLISEIITGIKSEYTTGTGKFQLYQNYPNPFNPSTLISFYIPERVNVSLKIYNEIGKEISVIFSGELSQGNYSKFWNGENFPAGVYYYTLRSGNFSETKKLLLLK